MTRDEVIKLSREAGVVQVNRAHQHLEPLWWSVTEEDLERFAELVAAAEREACANLCEERGNRIRIFEGKPNGDRDEFYCADDIRARGAK